MKHPERIEDYLQHIIEAIDHITGHVQEIDSAASLERDHKTQAAVFRNIEISPQTKSEPPALTIVARAERHTRRPRPTTMEITRTHFRISDFLFSLFSQL